MRGICYKNVVTILTEESQAKRQNSMAWNCWLGLGDTCQRSEKTFFSTCFRIRTDYVDILCKDLSIISFQKFKVNSPW